MAEDEVACQVWLFHGQTAAVSRVDNAPVNTRAQPENATQFWTALQ